jgi:ADP-ribose pyrophosphatase YjhB (NUDIX family)
MATRESEYMAAIAARNIVRPRIAAIVIADGKTLVQKPTDDPDACFAFIGGEYEVGDTFESRIKKEFEEETTAKVIESNFLFVVENRFVYNGKLIQGLEVYLEVKIDRVEVTSKEKHLSQHWLPLDRLREYNLRPHVARDVVAAGTYRSVRHLIVPLEQ